MRTRIDDLILYDGKGGRLESASVLFDENGIVAAGRGLKDAQGSPAHQFQARNQVSDGVSIALAHIFNRYTIDHIILH